MTRLPAELTPQNDDDERWLSDPELHGALAGFWSASDPRGIVAVWPQELRCLTAKDVPRGACIGICEDWSVSRLLRRGVEGSRVVMEASLRTPQNIATQGLTPSQYALHIYSAAKHRALTKRDIDYSNPFATADGMEMRVRLRLGQSRLDAANRAGENVLAEISATAEQAGRLSLPFSILNSWWNG